MRCLFGVRRAERSLTPADNDNQDADDAEDAEANDDLNEDDDDLDDGDNDPAGHRVHDDHDADGLHHHDQPALGGDALLDTDNGPVLSVTRPAVIVAAANEGAAAGHDDSHMGSDDVVNAAGSAEQVDQSGDWVDSYDGKKRGPPSPLDGA